MFCCSGICCSLLICLSVPFVCLVVRYPAKIIEVDDRDMTVLIHFDGWNQRYDEWVKMNSDQLKPLAETDRVKKEIPHTKSVSVTVQLYYLNKMAVLCGMPTIQYSD